MSVRDAERRIAMCDSQTRAAVLVEELQRTPSKPTARRMLREWFNVCEALAPHVDDLREQFERVGFVTDTKEKLDLPVTVYRAAWEDDDVEKALSWTTSLDTAKFFARHITSIRARLILGTYRDDVDPVIWSATCHEALGYLTGRDEHEVIPRRLTDITPILRLYREEATA